jgi:transketolase
VPEVRRVAITQPACEGWRDVTSTYKAQAIAEKKRAYSIETSGEVASALYDLISEIIMTCCADLEAPTNHKRRLEAFTATNRQGRYVHCGVREHAMGALANGIAAHGGVIPLAVTYLPFADYERPASRVIRFATNKEIAELADPSLTELYNSEAADVRLASRSCSRCK